MPTVPIYSSPTVQERGLPGVQQSSVANASMFGGTQGQQLQELGQAGMRTGGAFADIAAHEKQMADQVRVDDALNKVRQRALDLTFNQENGYLTQKGNSAWERASGQPLSDEYSAKLQADIAKIGEGLGNDNQRRAFNMRANDIATRFNGEVQRHQTQEYNSFQLSTSDATRKIGMDTAKLYWNDPEKISESLKSVQAAVYQRGKITGESASETAWKMKADTSAVHSTVIQSALTENNPAYASQYLKQYGKDMTADDLLKVQGMVKRDTDARLANGTAINAMAALKPKFEPSDFDRFMNITGDIDPNRVIAATQKTESNGQRYDKNGKLLEGPPTKYGTAKGEMQVLDSTNKDPGLGVTPARDNSPDERARVGRDYMLALVKRYGDVYKAWAAYNWGFGNLDKLLKTNPDDWKTKIPKETRDYVTKNVTIYNSGGGRPSTPTLQDVHENIRKNLGPGADPHVLKMSLDEGTRMYEDQRKAWKQQGEDAVRNAQQVLVQNGGNFTSLPPDIRAAVIKYAPDQWDNLRKFAGRSANPRTDTNMEAFNQAISNPGVLAHMSEAEFLHFQKENFSQADQEKIAKWRADAISGKSSDVVELPSQLRAMHDQLGWTGKSDAEKRGLFDRAVMDSITVETKRLGRELNYEERRKIIDRMAIEGEVLSGKLYMNDPNKRYYEVKGTKDEANFVTFLTANNIPNADKEAISKALERAGKKATDSEILRLYKENNGLK